MPQEREETAAESLSLVSQLGAGAWEPRSGAGSTGGHAPLDLTRAWATPESDEACGGFPGEQRAYSVPYLKNAHAAALGAQRWDTRRSATTEPAGKPMFLTLLFRLEPFYGRLYEEESQAG
jgi:hypothetical protein